MMHPHTHQEIARERHRDRLEAARIARLAAGLRTSQAAATPARPRQQLKTRSQLLALAVGTLLALFVVAATATAGGDRQPPRIVSAAMQDADRDSRADALRLTVSERIGHPRDADGKYPFAVAGYRIRSVAAAAGRAIVISVAGHADADH